MQNYLWLKQYGLVCHLVAWTKRSQPKRYFFITNIFQQFPPKFPQNHPKVGGFGGIDPHRWDTLSAKPPKGKSTKPNSSNSVLALFFPSHTVWRSWPRGMDVWLQVKLQMVTPLSINRAPRRVTLLGETNTLRNHTIQLYHTMDGKSTNMIVTDLHFAW